MCVVLINRNYIEPIPVFSHILLYDVIMFYILSYSSLIVKQHILLKYIALEVVSWTNQYWAMSIAEGNNGSRGGSLSLHLAELHL